GRGAVPRIAQREDLLRVPRDRDLAGTVGNPRLLLPPGPSRGLRDRRVGVTVRLVGARHPVLDRLRIPAPAAGPSRDGSDHEGGDMSLTHSLPQGGTSIWTRQTALSYPRAVGSISTWRRLAASPP